MIFVLFLFNVAVSVCLADSEGYGCYSKGYVTYDKAFKDPKSQYFVFFGKDVGISQPVKIELPFAHGSYSQGIKCEPDMITIALRANERNADGGKRTEYDIYLVEIRISAKAPKVSRVVKDHIQVWENYTKRSLKPIGGRPPTVLATATIDFNHRNADPSPIELESDDLEHKYFLTMETREKRERGKILPHIESKLVQKDLKQTDLKSLLLDEHEGREGID